MSESDSSDGELQAKVVTMVLAEPKKKRAVRKAKVKISPVAPPVPPPSPEPPTKADNLKMARAKKSELAVSKKAASSLVDNKLIELRKRVEEEEKMKMVTRVRKELRAASRRARENRPVYLSTPARVVYAASKAGNWGSGTHANACTGEPVAPP
jgi:hypothetical protein